MDELIPCSECNRHGRVAEGACPFCGAALSNDGQVPMPGRRMSRAAIVAFGASVAAGFGATGCGSDDDSTGSGGSGATSGSGGSGGSATGGQGGTASGGAAGTAGTGGAVGPLYGTPPPDGGAGQTGTGGGAGSASLYGLPPPDGG